MLLCCPVADVCAELLCARLCGALCAGECRVAGAAAVELHLRVEGWRRLAQNDVHAGHSGGWQEKPCTHTTTQNAHATPHNTTQHMLMPLSADAIFLACSCLLAVWMWSCCMMPRGERHGQRLRKEGAGVCVCSQWWCCCRLAACRRWPSISLVLHLRPCNSSSGRGECEALQSKSLLFKKVTDAV